MSNRKSKSYNKQKAVKGPRQKSRARRAPLDDAAASYARLLVDPCNAPLAQPVYPGGDSGFLFRAESFVTFGNGATDTSGVVHWTPGYVNSNATELISAGTTGGSVSGSLGNFTQSPGRSFLTANAKGVRCVAACMKVTYPGAENGRSGRVHFGLTQAGMLDTAVSVTPDNVAQTLQHYSRTPAETIEIIWKPNISDTEFNDPTEGASPAIRDRKAAITVAWAGLPASVGLTFHLTAVYEWTPAVGLGVGHNTLGKARSRNSLDDVLDFLVASGFGFVRNSAAAVGQGLAAGVLDTVSRAFGLMPAQSRSRSALTYH